MFPRPVADGHNESVTDYAFDLDTHSHELQPGLREATITDRWNTPNKTPNGGYVLAVMLQALRPQMGLPDPLVASVSFFKPASPGGVYLESTVLRTGRRLTTGETTLLQNDAAIAHLVASFRDRASTTGRNAELGSPPQLPPPDRCRAVIPRQAFDGIPIADRVEYRFEQAPGWAVGHPSGTPRTEYWVRFTDQRPIDLLALGFLVDAFPPAIAELGEFGVVTVQMTVHFHRVPTSQWVACSLRTSHVVDGYYEEDMEIWDDAGDLVAQSRQLALLL